MCSFPSASSTTRRVTLPLCFALRTLQLNEEEIERLDQFLLDRIDEDADTEGKDEGVLDIFELDGFFTALVSGPVVIPPSRWLPPVRQTIGTTISII